MTYDSQPREIETGDATITVLSVSPIPDDHQALRGLLCPPKWTLRTESALTSAAALLHRVRIPLVVCERDLAPATWKEMLDRLRPLPQPPYLIVTSRLADDYLWSEALNLGAYDVLAKPFDRTELKRILSLAWLHWNDQYKAAIPAPSMVRKPVDRTSRIKYASAG